MASAASLLTPHMLTEAYTSLLAALTVWDPAERHTDMLDEDRQARDTQTDKEVRRSDKQQGGRMEKQFRQVDKKLVKKGMKRLS